MHQLSIEISTSWSDSVPEEVVGPHVTGVHLHTNVSSVAAPPPANVSAGDLSLVVPQKLHFDQETLQVAGSLNRERILLRGEVGTSSRAERSRVTASRLAVGSFSDAGLRLHLWLHRAPQPFQDRTPPTHGLNLKLNLTRYLVSLTRLLPYLVP